MVLTTSQNQAGLDNCSYRDVVFLSFLTQGLSRAAAFLNFPLAMVVLKDFIFVEEFVIARRYPIGSIRESINLRCTIPKSETVVSHSSQSRHDPAEREVGTI
jgi:hypothetical protein